MRFILVFLFFLSNSYALDINVSKNPIYQAILVLNPSLPKKEALKYSDIIYKYSKMYEVDPFLVVSIARQESRLNLDTVREVVFEEIFFDNNSKKFIKKIELTDFCMMQINKANVISKKLDPDKLLKDPDYCIHEGFKILNFFKKFANSDDFWWTRYNSSINDHREIYKNYVLNHYSKISNIANSLPNESVLKNYLISFAE
jgi:hypothetical protein